MWPRTGEAGNPDALGFLHGADGNGPAAGGRCPGGQPRSGGSAALQLAAWPGARPGRIGANSIVVHDHTTGRSAPDVGTSRSKNAGSGFWPPADDPLDRPPDPGDNNVIARENRGVKRKPRDVAERFGPWAFAFSPSANTVLLDLTPQANTRSPAGTPTSPQSPHTAGIRRVTSK